jgi:hypothetical protein
MKNEFKAVMIAAAVLAVIAGAGQARAEVSIGVEVVGYTPAQVNWGAGSARLAEAAESLAEAVNSGDNALAGERLEGLFSGSGARSEAAPVYLAAAPAVPSAPRAVPAAELPKAVFKSALEDLGGVEAAQDNDGDIKPSKAEDEGGAAEEVVAAAAADPVETAPGPLWHTLLAGLLGIIIVLAIISLFPVVPLLAF